MDNKQRAELEKAAVIGRRFAFSIISKLSETSEEELLCYLESFIDIDIIHEIGESDDTFEFSHGKIRDVLYSRMSNLRRRMIHKKVADVLQQLLPHIRGKWDGVIGNHLFHAHAYEDACLFLLRAARASMEIYAVSEAADQFSRALQSGEKSHFPDGEDRIKIETELAEALKLAGDYRPALTILSGVIDSNASMHIRAIALNHLADILWLTGEFEKSFNAYRECEAIARDINDNNLLLEVVSDLCELHDRESERLSGIDPDLVDFHRRESAKYLEKQIALAQLSNIATAKSRAFRNAAKRDRASGRLSDALKNYEQAIAIADPRISSHQVLISYAKTLRFAGRLKDAWEVVQRVLEWGVQRGARRTEAIARQYRGMLLMEGVQSGVQSDDALRELSNSLAIHQEIGYERGKRETYLLLGELALRKANIAEALKFFDLAISKKASNTRELIQTVSAQLRAMGELERAEKLDHFFHSHEDNTT